MNKKYIVNWGMLHEETRKLAMKLLSHKHKWQKIIAITRGGLVPAAILARELNIRYIDTMCVRSYDKNNKQEEIEVLKFSEQDGNHEDEHVLIVDDLVDTGNTLKFMRTLYPKAYIVTIYAKPAGSLLVNNYMVQIPQDIWIELPWDINNQNECVSPLCDKI